MSLIPKDHPRAESLHIRERLVKGFHNELVAKEGLLAHGRGEAFDYLIGEKTSLFAKKAIKAAAAALLLANNSVISVNGNLAALCPKEVSLLAKITNSKVEVNLFYANERRKQNIVNVLKRHNAPLVEANKGIRKLKGISSSRKFVNKEGIFSADLVLVPLEDGDRTLALRNAGKQVITFDLNPLSRTAQNANITIVDNVVRGIDILIDYCKKLSEKDHAYLQNVLKKYNNEKILSEAILHIQKHLVRRATHA